jgi:ssDNA-binding Zn-finger/Zn-ribbon topoisomerase 1
MEKISIKVVEIENCPKCGGGYEFGNRPKVGDEDGRWWWKCGNPECKVGMYLPETGEWEEELTEKEIQDIMKEMDKVDFSKVEIEKIK